MIEKITEENAQRLCVASLPTRPTAPTDSGGGGLSSSEMKSAFDALTLYVIEKYNELIDAIMSVGEGSLASEVRTGISDGHTLEKMFEDLKSGDFASYLAVGDESLATEIAKMRVSINQIKARVGL